MSNTNKSTSRTRRSHLAKRKIPLYPSISILQSFTILPNSPPLLEDRSFLSLNTFKQIQGKLEREASLLGDKIPCTPATPFFVERRVLFYLNTTKECVPLWDRKFHTEVFRDFDLESASPNNIDHDMAIRIIPSHRKSTKELPIMVLRYQEKLVASWSQLYAIFMCHHVKNDHCGAEQTFTFINAIYAFVSRRVVHDIVGACRTCRGRSTTTSSSTATASTSTRQTSLGITNRAIQDSRLHAFPNEGKRRNSVDDAMDNSLIPASSSLFGSPASAFPPNCQETRKENADP
ncbi:uncharacterized protein BT62DRAFT_441013 [Guyanagaster necrorhizus]|uniref:Integrase zinc-binding domain-containing protein n=1 Tax=Guyanagaster necrorhizus TaxID=856835 RepID=A0A9P8AXJ3_9AGAR|nr:uncharacterized protein BT62DRAFT_441013 [Guyanagaster necrorhizus MCA 3950]KAG7451668.1 hypothetical protein BT62DRAFT_441013 [Guyanagaster necrorhizus MCA 3950]